MWNKVFVGMAAMWCILSLEMVPATATEAFVKHIALTLTLGFSLASIGIALDRIIELLEKLVTGPKVDIN